MVCEIIVIASDAGSVDIKLFCCKIENVADSASFPKKITIVRGFGKKDRRKPRDDRNSKSAFATYFLIARKQGGIFLNICDSEEEEWEFFWRGRTLLPEKSRVKVALDIRKRFEIATQKI